MFSISFDPEHSPDWNSLMAQVAGLAENIPFPPGFGFHFTQNVSVGQYYFLTVSHHNDRLHVNGGKWIKLQDWGRWNDFLYRRQLNGKFDPEIVTSELTLTKEEAEYFPGFFNELLHVHEGQVLEPITGILLDGSSYVLKMFRDEKLIREFRWDDNKRTRGILTQVIKLVSRR